MRDISEIAAAFLELIRSAALDILTSSRSYAEGGIAERIPAPRIDSYSESLTSFGHIEFHVRPRTLSLESDSNRPPPIAGPLCHRS